jgi:hypothetical protein
MSRLLFAFPVIAALAITPSSALAQHHHGGRHGGGWHGGGYHHPHHHPHYHHHHPHWNPYWGGGYYYGSGYQGYYQAPQFVQPPQQAYQIPAGYEGYPDGTVINYGGSNYVISGGVMYPAG